MTSSEKLKQIAALEQRHLDVLALAAAHLNSKEIGRTLGISPETVDQRMKRIKLLTGVSGRSEAARLYAQAQAAGMLSGEALYPASVYRPSELAPGAEPGMIGASLADQGATSGQVGRSGLLHEPQLAYDAAIVQWPTQPAWFERLLEGVRPNELSIGSRLMIIAIMTGFFVLIVAALVAIAEGLSRLV